MQSFTTGSRKLAVLTSFLSVNIDAASLSVYVVLSLFFFTVGTAPFTYPVKCQRHFTTSSNFCLKWQSSWLLFLEIYSKTINVNVHVSETVVIPPELDHSLHQRDKYGD